MGPGVDHPLATGPGSSGVGIQTGNWWHITGNGSDFSVDLTLPYSGADADSRVCRWPGGLGGYGWNCGNDANTSPGAGTVTRTGVDSFSDWAVGDHVGPTAVSLHTFTAQHDNGRSPLPALAGVLLLSLGAAVYLTRSPTAPSQKMRPTTDAC
jgi:hypothetical protein